MRKFGLISVLISALVFAGCGTGNDRAAHRESNLIITNYSDCEIADVAVIHDGKIVGASEPAVKDTQICYFTVEAADHYGYTVSFKDQSGGEHSREFTGDFTGDEPVLLAVNCIDGVWTIDYDR